MIKCGGGEGWDWNYIWSFLFPYFSFRSWLRDFSIMNNCSIQALLSISEMSTQRAREAGLQAAFKAHAQGEMSGDAWDQTHRALPRHLGFHPDALKNGHFPLTQSVQLLLGHPGGWAASLHHLFAAWGKTQVTCFHATFCSGPLGSCWRGAARRAHTVNTQALSKRGDLAITASPTC